MIGFCSAGRLSSQARIGSGGVFTFMRTIYHNTIGHRSHPGTFYKLRTSSLRKSWDYPTTTLRTLLEILFQDVQHVVIIATCRLEDEERVRARLGQLFTELEVVRLPRFSVDIHDPEASKIIADFQRHGATHFEDWDGTLGSL